MISLSIFQVDVVHTRTLTSILLHLKRYWKIPAWTISGAICRPAVRTWLWFFTHTHTKKLLQCLFSGSSPLGGRPRSCRCSSRGLWLWSWACGRECRQLTLVLGGARPARVACSSTEMQSLVASSACITSLRQQPLTSPTNQTTSLALGKTEGSIFLYFCLTKCIVIVVQSELQQFCLMHFV